MSDKNSAAQKIIFLFVVKEKKQVLLLLSSSIQRKIRVDTKIEFYKNAHPALYFIANQRGILRAVFMCSFLGQRLAIELVNNFCPK